MISKKMQKMLNEQFMRELSAAILYLSMSSYFERKNLKGFANFFRVQSEEEFSHAMKFFDYIHDVRGMIDMDSVPKPPANFSSILEVFEETLKREKETTKDINEIVRHTFIENDFATNNFLQWFVKEQVEEESSISYLLEQLKMIGDNKSALYLMDKELATRKFTEE